MITTLERPEQRIVLHNIGWRTYETLLADAGESHVRFTFDDGDLEIMTLSYEHENAGEWIGRLIAFLALELDIEIASGGSTTLRSALRRKGLEADKSFWIQNEPAMRGKNQWQAEIDPPPDLVVEVDITRSSLDRHGIYAALEVPEIWRFDGKAFRVLTLGAQGRYRPATKSRSFPQLPVRAFAVFVEELGSAGETSLIKSFRKWMRRELRR